MRIEPLKFVAGVQRWRTGLGSGHVQTESEPYHPVGLAKRLVTATATAALTDN